MSNWELGYFAWSYSISNLYPVLSVFNIHSSFHKIQPLAFLLFRTYFFFFYFKGISGSSIIYQSPYPHIFNSRMIQFQELGLSITQSINNIYGYCLSHLKLGFFFCNYQTGTLFFILTKINFKEMWTGIIHTHNFKNGIVNYHEKFVVLTYDFFSYIAIFLCNNDCWKHC